MNYFKTFLLMTGLLALMMFIGQLIGGAQGMFTFFMFGLITNFISYWFSDKIVLMFSGAKKTQENDIPQVYRIIKELTQKANLPMPKIYIMETAVPNAFATGRNPKNAAVAVTTGILQLLEEHELRGVLAHELAHVQNRDILISTVASSIAGAIMMMSRMALWFGPRNRDDDHSSSNPIVLIIIAILAPIAAMIIQMAISRSREFGADTGGAKITGDPLSLASALKKLQTGISAMKPTEPNPATAHLYIVSPFTGKSLVTLFSTHPPMEERVKRLETLAAQIS